MIEQDLAPASLEELEQMLHERSIYLDQIGQDLEKKKDEAVTWRASIEKRFIDAHTQYNDGTTSLAEAKVTNGKELHRGSPDNITFTKVRAISSRIQDMLFPSNDRNWDLEVAESERVAPISAVQDPMAGEQAVVDNTVYAKKAEVMEKLVADDLMICEYSKHSRQAIDDGCQYGTGVIRGPFAKSHKSKKKSVTQTAFGPVVEVQITEEIKPSVEHIDLWNFYPQPSRCIEECDYVFDLIVSSKRQIMALANQPGFDANQIKRLLEREPEHGALMERPLYARAGGSSGDGLAMIKNRYTMWRYVGPVGRKCLEMFGINPDEISADLVIGEVYVCQGIVLKACLLPISDSEKLPFHVWNYEKDPNCIFGYGVPYRCRADQHVANIAWSAAQYNAVMSSGVQMGILKGALESTDGNNDYSFDRPRIWAIGSQVSSIDQAISFSVVPNVTGPILEVYDRAKANADEHTMLPVMAQGEANKAITTSSGLALMMNETNIIQRNSAQSWDEQITMPLLRQMIKFEQENRDDGLPEELQGEFEVIPKASSHLLVKDMRLQHSMTLLAMADNPNNSMFFNREELIRGIVSDINYPGRVLRTPEEVQKAMEMANQQQTDPNAGKLEVEKYKADLDAQVRREEIAAEAERERMRSETAIVCAQMSREGALARAAALENVSIADLQAKLEMQQTDIQTKQIMESIRDAREREKAQLKSQDMRFTKGMDAELKAQGLAQNDSKIKAQIAAERPLRI